MKRKVLQVKSPLKLNKKRKFISCSKLKNFRTRLLYGKIFEPIFITRSFPFTCFYAHLLPEVWWTICKNDLLKLILLLITRAKREWLRWNLFILWCKSDGTDWPTWSWAVLPIAISLPLEDVPNVITLHCRASITLRRKGN